MLKINYDNEFDILYISFNSTINSYGDDRYAGIVILKDIDTDNITGVTIFGFKKKYVKNNLPDLKLPYSLDYMDLFSQITHK